MTHARAWLVLILQVDLIVQKGHDQTACGTSRPALFTLVAPHGIITVQRALAFLIQTSKNGVNVVWEEALVVEDVAQPLRARGDGHGLVVLVFVHLDDGIEAFLECIAVRREPHDGQYYPCSNVFWPFTTDSEQLWRISSVNVVP